MLADLEYVLRAMVAAEATSLQNGVPVAIQYYKAIDKLRAVASVVRKEKRTGNKKPLETTGTIRTHWFPFNRN